MLSLTFRPHDNLRESGFLHPFVALCTSMPAAPRMQSAGTRREREPDAPTGAPVGVQAGAVSVEGLAVTWSRTAVYYLPMGQLRRLPTVWSLVAAVLQSPSAEKVSAMEGTQLPLPNWHYSTHGCCPSLPSVSTSTARQ